MISMNKNVCVEMNRWYHINRLEVQDITSKESFETLGFSKYGLLLIAKVLYTILKYVLDQLLKSMDSLIWNLVLILYAN